IAGQVIGATATHVFFLGHSGNPERYEILSVGADGRVAFRKAVAVSPYIGALSPSHQVLLAWTAPDDEKTGHPECGLSALDAATGETLWEKVVPFSGS